MPRTHRVLASVVLGVMIGGLAGCGQMTTAPEPQATTSAVTVAPGNGSAATATSTNSISTTTQGLLSPLESLTLSLVGLLVRTLNLVGSLGGTLTQGRWNVVVPPNAIQGTATVAIGVSSEASSDCQLEIMPATKNHFNVPVVLTVDCSSVPPDKLAGYVILWFNPATRRWVPVEGSKVDLVRKTVSAPLLHFSRYSVGPADGKAGW